MLTTCEKNKFTTAIIVVSVVCHFVTSAVAPVLPVVPVVSVVVKTKARQLQIPDKQKQQILCYQREQAHSRTRRDTPCLRPRGGTTVRQGLQTDELFNDSRTVAESTKKVLTERHCICNIHTSRQNVVFYAVLIENISLFRRINKKMQDIVTKK